MNLPSRSRFLPVLALLAGANVWGAGPWYNILDYGARNDGSASATGAIRAAIQAAGKPSPHPLGEPFVSDNYEKASIVPLARAHLSKEDREFIKSLAVCQAENR